MSRCLMSGEVHDMVPRPTPEELGEIFRGKELIHVSANVPAVMAGAPLLPDEGSRHRSDEAFVLDLDPDPPKSDYTC